MTQRLFRLFPLQQLQAFGELITIVFYNADDTEAVLLNDVVTTLSVVGEWQRFPARSEELQLFECPASVVQRRACFAQQHTALYAMWLLSAALGFHPLRRWTLSDAIAVADCVSALNDEYDVLWAPRDFSVWHQRRSVPKWMAPLFVQHDVSLVLEQHELLDADCNLFRDCKLRNLRNLLTNEWTHMTSAVRQSSRAELRLNERCLTPAFVPFSPLNENKLVAYNTPFLCEDSDRVVSYKLKRKAGTLHIAKTFTANDIQRLYDSSTSTPSPTSARAFKSAPDLLSFLA
jgi:hypothetical protein